jgi:photosystem II stability/assembly factor-like uncharacterized protein
MGEQVIVDRAKVERRGLRVTGTSKWQPWRRPCLCVIGFAAAAVLLPACGVAGSTVGSARNMGWVLQQSGTGRGLMGVCFTNVKDGWAVGEAGTLLATADGGVHWRLVDSGTSEDLVAVKFTDRSHGWALGENEVIWTGDAGRHWSLVRLGAALDLGELAFADNRHGIVAGVVWKGNRARGIILSTSDGGKRWHTTWEQRQDFRFTESEVLVGGHTIAPYAIGIVDRHRSLVAAGAGFILSSSDGGEHWSLSYDEASVGILSPVFPTTSEGWAVTSYGHLLDSRDGGRTWHYRQTVSRSELWQIAFSSKMQGWIVGGETLLRTSDGGEHWSVVTGFPASFSPQAVTFVEPDHGWVVGDDGAIYAYH